ncbi:MAG: Peptidase M22 glycoprotease [Thermotoga sp. 50_1627]|uniref:tRNA (adenosine(37)-N6)-threonylcarbamoyltransferase complex dimerization subunit type 1 TsaB n=1 Tax=Pseudothermotoga sp. TaxID=2033661 RepID=UPI00076CDDFE|nr:MAG: Peptidase M22 glycoprotease [Thermotoga sp. 50_64]KUK25881.1 MAG: Peptidase M22 glycoprotease [Thermotoga sp. 50_1627]MBC7116136.1 tRNA (adenosine(37)-N6)-threonylcarbamoyltransferase complex dimerization subunit type 1 TsaB [Pseudothermotoga sp.]MDK2922825.1 tRNA threonylcarbamoyladenosine biosynthesis protein TsaB [Pseudothermotoga sp.]HCO98055.1 tRNA (adenosine(37)-N6)-threonylcarbamoyltransferase complex dimerization subunit type 1 TsaB [Pseudothermotoga sp.]
MKIFAIDTSTEAICVAYTDGQNIYSTNYFGVEKHAVKLAPLVDDFLKLCRVRVSDIDVFGCGIGPGSLTSLRIAVAFVQAMACVTSKPIVPVVSSKVVAMNFSGCEHDVVIVKKARQGFVYISCYRNLRETISPSVVEVQKTRDILKSLNDPILVGDAAHMFESVARIGKKELQYPRGEFLLNEVVENLKANVVRKPHEVEPLYLQKSIAEMNLEKHLKG